MKAEITIRDADLEPVILEHVRRMLGPDTKFTHVTVSHRYCGWEAVATDDEEVRRDEAEKALAELAKASREAKRATGTVMDAAEAVA